MSPTRNRRGLPWPVRLTLDIGVSPLAFFLMSGVAGASTAASLLVSVGVGALWTIGQLLATRKVNAAAVCVVAGLVVGAVLTGISGDARFGVAKDSLYTAVFGLAMLVSLAARRPLMFALIRPFATEDGDPAKVAEWNAAWVSPLFRRGMRTMTVVWGVGLLVEAVTRIAVVYGGFPVAYAAALSPVLTAVVLAALMSWTAWYGRKAGEARRRVEGVPAP
ncbi:VC0807 family protein [Kutzneria chonburiensis]|uniref:VC0807 family protein n=1 Tax=Kutzneria chonburiensis TaxID=1483604 RepID=A0ABV6MZI9_9PSEU|nr:VC0807 family protein [Kutzneria chonburiensis]